jgi:hypothetical protein
VISPPTPSERSDQPAGRRPGKAGLSLAQKLTYSFILMTGLAVGVEVAIRIEDWIRYRMPVVSPFGSMEHLIVRDADGVHGRANAQFEQWVMNELGTRGPSAPVVPAAGVIRIITVGASETFGLWESPDHEFPRQMEDSLNTRLRSMSCPRAPVRFEVLNAAFAGMTIPTIEQDVRRRLARYHPSMIAAYLPSSGYLYDVVPVAATPDTSRQTASVQKPGSVFQLRATKRVRDLLRTVLPENLKAWLRRRDTEAAISAHDSSWRYRSPPPERLAAFDADLRRLVGAIRAIGATPILITHGNAFMGRAHPDEHRLVEWEKFFPRATPATLVAFDSLARLDILKIAADSNAVSVDAARSLASSPPSSFADPTHLTDLGAGVVAGDVARTIFTANDVVRACAGGGPTGPIRSEAIPNQR